MNAKNETYLGDGVHASFDGWQICLRTSDDNRQRIYLEPEVLSEFLKFVADIQKQIGE